VINLRQTCSIIKQRIEVYFSGIGFEKRWIFIDGIVGDFVFFAVGFYKFGVIISRKNNQVIIDRF